MSNQRPSSLAVGERKNRIVVRGTAGKRKHKALSQKVTLERVLGITVKDNCTLTCDPNTGHVAYVAGCVIVIFNPRRNKQYHIFNQSRKTLTALSFSGDGRYLVSGECGHNPAVRIWDVQDKTQVAEFHGHKYGISCVGFSPDMQYVVSIGEQHDMVVNVWDWKKNIKHSSGKVAAQVTGLAFSEDGSFFVAVGNRCVKFYYLMGKSRTRQIQAIPGRSGILGEQRNNFFVSVACGKGENRDKVYAITRSGFLCELNNKRILDKWVELRTTGAHSITADEEYIFVACDGGIIRLFSASTLHFVATLPKPHYLGVNVSAGIDASHMSAHRDNAQYPDAIALMFDSENKKLTCVYNDHSMYIWDIHDVKKIGKQWSFLYHSACIFGVETYPELSDGNRAALPAGSFFTCSSDGTIRIWNMDPTMNTTVHKRNIYSHELLKVLYVGEDSLENLQDRDIHTPAQGDKTDLNIEKGKAGIRCMRVSPDGQMLASGDRSGNVRVHDLQFWDQLHEIEAHDSEVLCLEYTQPNTGYNLLASASRDRLIHVFDMDKNCSLVQTLDDHSSSITSVKFNRNGEQLQMISCGADKALMFRIAVYNPDLQFVRNHHVVNKTTLYDLAIDTTQKYITTACQDRNLRIYNIVSGKLKRTYKGAQSDEGTLIRVELDPSGIYAATSCSDKSLNIYDFYSGECVATMMGHSELVTGIKFTSDCKQLISVAGDGCIFIWKLPWELTHNMKERLKEMGEKVVEPPPEYNMLRRGTYVVPPELPPEPKAQVISAWQAKPAIAGEFQPAMQSRPDTEDETDDREPDEDSTPEECNFETGLLPLWAQKQVKAGNDIPDVPSPTKYSSPTHPRGRWAQNINSGGIKVKSQMEELNQSIELRLEDCFDRRRYTVEPDVLLEQVRPFANRSQGPFAGMDAEEIAKICGDEFVPASQKFGLLSQEEFEDSETMDGFVTTSRGSDPRGSDPFGPPASLRAAASTTANGANGAGQSNAAENGDGTKVDDLEGDDEEEEEEEDDEEKEDDAADKEMIFYPPEEEEESSPESLKFQVTESTQSHEELAKRHSRHKSKEGSKENLTSIPTSNADSGMSAISSTDGNEDDDGDESDDEEEEEEEEESGNITPTASPRRSKLTPIEPPSPTTTPDEEKFLHTNFSFAEKEKNIGDFTEQENFGKCLEQLQSRFNSDEISSGRLSISSRFLSRSQHSIRSAPMMSQSTSSMASAISPEEYLRRRKEEVARAVEETRKRLTSLGWNMGDKKTANAPSTATSAPVGAKVKPAIPPRLNPPAQRKIDPPTSELPSTKDPVTAPNPSQTDSVLCNVEKKDNVSVESASVNGHTMPKDVGVKRQTEDIPGDGTLDKNRHASKESSQGSSPETSTKAKDQEAEEKSSDSLKNVRNSALDEVLDETLKGTKSPKHVIRQPSEEDTISCDFEAEVDSNKENVSSVAMLNKKKMGEDEGTGVPDTKPVSGGDRSKSADKKTNMRRGASLTDLRKDNLEKNESPTLTPPSQSSHTRSSSSDRIKKQSPSDSPARQKRREKAERMLPLLPTPKTRSYEGRTESSMAKVVRRISESPPPSPNTRRKKMSLGASTLSKSGPLKATDPSLMNDAKSDVDQDLNSEASVESSKASEDGASTGSRTAAADKLAMPPPASTHVSKAKPGKKMANTKMSDRGRKRSSSVTLSGGTSRGRRSSTSSLPPSTSESRSKTLDSKSKIPTANVKPTVPSRSPKSTTDAKLDTSETPCSTGSKETDTVTIAQGGDSAIDSTPSASVNVGRPHEPSISTKGTLDETKSKAEEAEEEREADKSSSVSEDTMVSETGKARTTSHQQGVGEGQKKPVDGITASGSNTPEEVKAMRADLRIDLDDITVDGREEDPGIGLRQSVDAMKKAFDQCMNYVAMIEMRGNHRQDLNYFSSTFAAMDKSYDTRVAPVVRRSNNASPENTLSDASEGCLNNNNSGDRAFAETSRSLPSLSDLLDGGQSSTIRDRLDKRAASLDASSPQALAMLQHYSDMLVNLVRSKMEDSDDGLLSGRSRMSSLDLEGED